jgi:hypothetical protein
VLPLVCDRAFCQFCTKRTYHGFRRWFPTAGYPENRLLKRGTSVTGGGCTRTRTNDCRWRSRYSSSR